jgi:hypothetical protein
MIFCPDDSHGRVPQLHIRLPAGRIFKPVLQSAGSAHLSDPWRISTLVRLLADHHIKIINYQLSIEDQRS